MNKNNSNKYTRWVERTYLIALLRYNPYAM